MKNIDDKVEIFEMVLLWPVSAQERQPGLLLHPSAPILRCIGRLQAYGDLGEILTLAGFRYFGHGKHTAPMEFSGTSGKFAR